MNKEILVQDHSECLILSALIQKLEQHYSDKGQVICKISVNGLPLSEADECRLAQTSLNEIQEIQIELGTIQTVVSETRVTIKKLIENLKVESQNVSEQMRDKGAEAGSSSFFHLISNVQNLTHAFIALKPHLSASTVTAEFESRWAQSTQHMIATLKELTTAYTQQDYILVADVLEYELDNSLENWKAILSSIG